MYEYNIKKQKDKDNKETKVGEEYAHIQRNKEGRLLRKV